MDILALHEALPSMNLEQKKLGFDSIAVFVLAHKLNKKISGLHQTSTIRIILCPSVGMLRLRRPEGVRLQQRAHRRLLLRRRQRHQRRNRRQEGGRHNCQEDETGDESFLIRCGLVLPLDHQFTGFG